jgi:DNA-binding winged helix-turn-helix (wHTH) protein/TolB-like protein/Flp pilus assembly protein TadD
MAQSVRHIYEFDNFQLDRQRRRLLKDGEAVALSAKALEILLILVENRGRVVEKEELMQRVWADSFVEEANLTVHMSALRKALGETRRAPHFIATISGRGYRFLAEVKEVEEKPDDRTVNLPLNLEADAISDPRLDQAAVLDMEKTPELIVEEHILSHITVRGMEQESTHRPVASRSRPVIAILLIASAVSLGFLIYRFVVKPSVSDPGIQSIAILPFKPINTGASNEILELGMAETLISKFSSTGRIIVRPTSAIRKYGNPEQDPLAAGRELGVEAVLDGSIQQLRDRLRITVYLLNVKTGLPLWSEQYNESYEDIFALQDKVSKQVAQALTLRLTGAEQQQLTKHPTNNPEAYQAYLQGRYFWNKRTQEGYRKAIGYFDEALKRDPNFALACSGLADCYLFTAEQLPSKEAMPKAKAAALKALELDDSLAEVHTSLAKIEQFYDWDWRAAEQSFKRALALNPNYQTAHHWYAQLLMDVGREEEAFKEINRARDLEPFSLIINTDVGSLFQDARQYEQAIVVYKKVIEMDANFARAHFELGRALGQIGNYTEAIKEIQKAMELSEASPRMLASLGYVYAVSGNPAKAQEVIAGLHQAAKQSYVSPYHLATIYAGLGKKEEALSLLEQAYEERFGLLAYLRIEPRFDTLRPEPRFKELMRRLGLDPEKP